jgi:hypothetical protein
MAISCVIPEWMEQVSKSYEQDDKCIELLSKISIDPQSVTNFTLQNGILRYKNKLVIGNSGPLKQQLLDSFH